MIRVALVDGFDTVPRRLVELPAVPRRADGIRITGLGPTVWGVTGVVWTPDDPNQDVIVTYR